MSTKALDNMTLLPLTRRDLELEREILVSSNLFDAPAYLDQAGEVALSDPIGHYLQKGWLLGFEPNTSFPGSLLRICFAGVGRNEPPAISWALLNAAGWPIPATHGTLISSASEVRDSGLFDDSFYSTQVGSAAITGIDAAIHYLAVGERLGFAPSPGFDPAYYAARYPDVGAAGLNLLLHFTYHGRSEGRSPYPEKRWRLGRRTLEPAKENVLLVVHEASRTGAPILGWNIALQLSTRFNIYTVCLGDGDLFPEFEALSAEVHGPFRRNRSEEDLEFALKDLLAQKKFRYAIVNSAESRGVLHACARRYIPTLLLMHEFGSYVTPVAALRTALDRSTEIVFPAHVVAQSAEHYHPALSARSVHICPQGVSMLPKRGSAQDDIPDVSLGELTRRHEAGTFIVLGAGAVQLRKGVDLFLSTAAAVVRSQPQRSIEFLWVGHGFQPEIDMGYSVYLQEQLVRCGLSSCVTFLNEVTNLEPVYQIADTFFLSSRLDPLPNVSIDAAVRGIPIVCFRAASGTAELLLHDPETARGVVNHLDTEAAGRIIIELAHDEFSWKQRSEATRHLAEKTFDMEAYVSKLDTLGAGAAARMEQRIRDAETLLGDPTFDQAMFLGASPVIETRAASIARYLTMSGARGWHDEESSKGIPRPAAGFNPRIYAAEHHARLTGNIDPLADFVRRGKPAGPWQLPVLHPSDPGAPTPPSNQLRVALHAHFFYPDLAEDFLARLRFNQARCDLLISTDTVAKARRLERVLADYDRGSKDIRLVPNRGRDVGPLLTGLAKELAAYDVIGHVHAKRSLLIEDRELGESWREFLWQHLIGSSYPMMDRIIAEFERQNNLGLIFPSDSHLVGWDTNRIPGADLAGRMGWKGPLPEAFDFPLGTMFWMRYDALRPLLECCLDWEDYPQEPVPYDGTILHSVERLIPLAAKISGFSSAVTHVHGISW